VPRSPGELGLIAEIHPREKLLARAWALPRKWRPEHLLLRYTRITLIQPLKQWDGERGNVSPSR